MIVMQLSSSKKTDNKLRWSANVEEDQTEFKLYIPKWRVPIPWPALIRVTIGEASSMSESRDAKGSPIDFKAPIRARVHRFMDMVHSVRFTPEGDPSLWEIGEPYIPYSLLPTPDTQSVDIEVEWDLSAPGVFLDRSALH